MSNVLAYDRVVTDPKRIPNKEHYAIIVWVRVAEYTGYEKPGESPDTSLYARYYLYAATEYGEWSRDLAALHTDPNNRDPFMGIQVRGKAKLAVSVNVEVEPVYEDRNDR